MLGVIERAAALEGDRRPARFCFCGLLEPPLHKWPGAAGGVPARFLRAPPVDFVFGFYLEEKIA